jgi:hypothetical protein
MSKQESKNVVIDGKSIGTIIERPSDRVYMGIEVTKARADGREEDECQADPCVDEKIRIGELQQCAGCGIPFDPHHLTEGECPACRDKLQVFEINVYETIKYTAHIEADSQAQAERAVESMCSHDWEPVRKSAELDEYGYETNKRHWDIWPRDRNQFIDNLSEKGLVISALEWDQD